MPQEGDTAGVEAREHRGGGFGDDRAAPVDVPAEGAEEVAAQRVGHVEPVEALGEGLDEVDWSELHGEREELADLRGGGAVNVRVVLKKRLHALLDCFGRDCAFVSAQQRPFEMQAGGRENEHGGVSRDGFEGVDAVRHSRGGCLSELPQWR